MRTGKRGFTLPEVLVTIAIVATLAAVLLPALNGQLSKGEASRVAADLLSIQTAANTFVSDVRRYPGRLNHLTASTITGQSDINATVYPAVLAAKIRGPYLAKALETGDSLATGFGLYVQPVFTKPTYNGIPYLTATVRTITLDDFNKIDLILDETAGSSTGQWTLSGTEATFRALPIQ